MDYNWERKAELQKHKVDENKQEDIQCSGGSVSVDDIGPNEEESTRSKLAEKRSSYWRLGPGARILRRKKCWGWVSAWITGKVSTWKSPVILNCQTT